MHEPRWPHRVWLPVAARGQQERAGFSQRPCCVLGTRTVTVRGLCFVSFVEPYHVDAAIVPSTDGKVRHREVEQLATRSHGCWEELEFAWGSLGFRCSCLWPQAGLPLWFCGLEHILRLLKCLLHLSSSSFLSQAQEFLEHPHGSKHPFKTHAVLPQLLPLPGEWEQADGLIAPISWPPTACLPAGHCWTLTDGSQLIVKMTVSCWHYCPCFLRCGEGCPEWVNIQGQRASKDSRVGFPIPARHTPKSSFFLKISYCPQKEETPNVPPRWCHFLSLMVCIHLCC